MMEDDPYFFMVKQRSYNFLIYAIKKNLYIYILEIIIVIINMYN